MKHILISCFCLASAISSITAISTRNDSHISNIQPAALATSRHAMTRITNTRRNGSVGGKSKHSAIADDEKRLTEMLSKKNLNNHEVMRKLGLSKIRMSPNHQKKRLAVESRNHRADDSHMFVIKLPPNPYYYAQHNKNAIDDSHKKVPVGFKSNGKPGKIYHWNIPVLKKILGTNHGRHNANYRHIDDEADLIDIKHIPTWTKPWENEAYDKPTNGKHDHEKVLKKKSPSYYAPAVKARQTNFNKYFTSNGKPQSFYVIENHKPISYHKLIQ